MHRWRGFGLVVCGLFAVGCGKEAPQEQPSLQKQASVSRDIRTVRLHFDGFTKSESGATWMA